MCLAYETEIDVVHLYFKLLALAQLFVLFFFSSYVVNVIQKTALQFLWRGNKQFTIPEPNYVPSSFYRNCSNIPMVV